LAKNTKVEWSRLKVSRGSVNLNILSTNHKKTWTAAVSGYLKYGYLINEADHNHPSGNHNPSGMYEPTGDCVTAELIFKYYKNAKLSIFTAQDGEYSRYNEEGPLLPFQVFDIDRNPVYLEE